MKYKVIADTDIGIRKKVNQDSVLIKHAKYEENEILMAIICDGMGGLENGEVASATVIRAFAHWFNNELVNELNNPDLNIIATRWTLMLKELNSKISHFGASRGSMGTTFTGILFILDQYIIVHVGDTRVYQIDSDIKQITTDQTFIEREVSKGTMTYEQAMQDRRRNMLLQCIGASPSVEPEIITGQNEKCVYMLCSDGFRHEITSQEIYESLNPIVLKSVSDMKCNARNLIEINKQRNEKDNISVVVIKVEQE